MHRQHCSGTVILNFAQHQNAVPKALDEAKISVDERKLGIRVSPHIYNTRDDITQFILVVQEVLQALG